MDFINFDTDFMPSLSKVDIIQDDGKDNAFAILEFVATAESKDPNITIIPNEKLESDYFKDLIEKGICKIVGGGVTTKSIPALMYGIQHTSRVMYKHTIQEAFRKFTTDDEFIRDAFNNIIANDEESGEENAE